MPESNASSERVHGELENGVSREAGLLPVTPEVGWSKEQRRVLFEFNETLERYPESRLVQEPFEEQAARAPEAVAVVYEGQSLTYGELNAKANQLALYLREAGIVPDDLVGICLERGLQMVVGLFGILKAGGAYIPLDPSYPEERLRYMLEDAAPTAVITNGKWSGRARSKRAKTIVLDEEAGEIWKDGVNGGPAQSTGVCSGHLAYVMYTSGSTGKPKGVMIEHGAVVNLLRFMHQRIGMTSADCLLAVTTLGFDIAGLEIYLPLMSGARVVIAPRGAVSDASQLIEMLETYGVTTMQATPATWKLLVDGGWKGRPSLRALCGGEALTARLSRGLVERVGKLWNVYGPTETTIWSCIHEIGVPDECARVEPIGRPIANTRIYILTSDLVPLPIGAIGEIYVGGAGVARGYLNRPELTAERFVRDPFSDDPKARMYKTGDLGRWRADGTIEYLGRNDHQVKIRGFRIELGEIEAQLARHPEIKEAVVLAREDEPGEKRLVGYVIARDKATAPDGEALREHLKGVLPDYMVPSAFVMLESFPLTPNGKLDRRALPAPDLTAYTSRQYEAPQGEVEEILAGIWQELLRVQRVGRNDNFFELGGHSLLIVHMLERLRRVGLSAEVRRVFESPTLSDLAGSLMRGAEAIEVPPNLIPQGCERITPQMLPLVELEQTHIDRIVEAVPGGAANVQDIYPLAPLQEGILFHHLLDQERGDTYLLTTLLSVASRERLEELVSALQAVIDRHDVLRTAIIWELLPRPLQVVYRQATLPVEEIDLGGNDDPLKQLREAMKQHHDLDVRQPPLMRLQTATVGRTDRWYVLLRVHHLVCDAHSVEVLLAEFKSHLESPGQPLSNPIPYRNHVMQALGYARAHDVQAFFRDKLAKIDEPTAPFGLLDVRGDGSQIEESRQDLDGELAKRVRTQARRLGVSAATLFHAACALVVSRSSGREDVVYGTVLLGRMQGGSGAERSLGVFINTLPVRLPLQGLTAKALVERTQRELVELLGQEQASLAEAQRCSGIVGSAPLFTTLLNYRHSTSGLEEQWASAGEVEMLGEYERTNYPITILVDDLGEGFTITTQTDRPIAPHRVLGYVRTAMVSLVEALEEASHEPVLSLQVLPEEERRQVIEGFNPVHQYRQEELMQELFEGQVRLHPQAVAVSCEGRSLTYAELNARSNQLAWHLRERGIGAEQRVGICMERSLEMAVGLLGILKAGGAYVPLDPSYPAERLTYVLGDAAPSVVLTQEHLKGRLPKSAAEVVMIDTDWDVIGKRPTRDPALRPQGLSADSLAYVIYTSGSTGKPKGVMVEHRNVARLFAATQSWFGFNEQDVWTLFHSFAFDFSVWELWGALLYGGRVVIVPHLTARSPQEFYRLLCREGVTVLNQTPSAFAQLAQAQGECPDLRHALRVVIFGGEALEFRALRPWVQRNGTEQPRLINMYGITETTVHVTYRQLCKEEIESERGSIIGRPIPDLKTYLLDRHRQPVPIGVAGEIYVGGAGVARGYLNRPELTAERFVRDPFSDDPKARMYKTGDLGRWRADGTIEYLGRNDHQVKIRGFRIELGEIEAQLARHPEIKEAVVLAREDEPGEKRLVGYVIARDKATAPDGEALREHLKGVLPDYMVPSAFVMLESFPLTPNGKLDRRALPAPDLTAYTSRQYEAPQGEVEEILAGIWQELLRVQRVGRNDNFFELGGHSLLIVHMLERLRRVGLSAEVRRVFESPTLSDLAGSLMRGAEAIEVPPNLIPQGCERITPQMLPLVELEQTHIDRIVEAVPGGAANVQDIYPLAPLQEGILFHHLLDQERGDTYLLTTLLSVASRERLEELVSALQAVIDRHDVLRTAIIWELLPRPLQVVYRQATLPVEESALDDGRSVEEQVQDWVRFKHQRIDLRRAPLMRLKIAHDPESGRWYVLQQLHHMTCDHVTADAITSEVAASLQGRAQRVPDPIPYRNHVMQALGYARAHDVRAFFRDKLAKIDEPTAPFGLLDVRGDGSQIEESRQDLDGELAKRVRTQARRLGVSAATLFHAACALVVSRSSGREDVVYGTVLLGRMQGGSGAERSLGVFINTLPVRLPLQGLTAKALVERTQRELVELLGQEQASLAEAQRCSGIVGSAPLFTTLLNYRHSTSGLEEQWASAGEVEMLGEYERTNYPITILVDDLGEGFTITTQTDRPIAPHRVLGYVRTAMVSLVEALEEASHEPVLSLQVLPEEEWREVIHGMNDTKAPYPNHKLLHELIEEQVSLTPDAVAVVYEDQSLTYSELNTQANQLAWHLRERGVGPEQLVGICMGRSLEMVVGMLGILKAGGAYVPLDPGYPAERLAYMLDDASPSVVLTQKRFRGRLAGAAAQVVALDADWEGIATQPMNNPEPRLLELASDQLAYVIYTSGSTGKPKGVAIEHRNAVNLIHWARSTTDQTQFEHALFSTSLNFDLSVYECFVPLSVGGRVYVVENALELITTSYPVSFVNTVPSAIKGVLEGGKIKKSVRVINLAGEALKESLVRSIFESSSVESVRNLYAPSETTTYSTMMVISRHDRIGVSIGRPIWNTDIYILDPRCQPMPIGVAGEIYVGGAGVARGYLNRPELTAERFVRDPFSDDPKARMYKTGDLGRWRADGTIEYLGRNDHQVKIRGFRIELGEIEAQLARHPEIKEAVVLAREDEPGEKRLVGYVIARDKATAPDGEALREHLKGVLPDYMVPSAFVMLESFPLTPNGKLDRRALPAPDLTAYTSRQYEAPQGEVEEILAGIWQELLRVQRVGRNDNFFELGGHSLLIVHMLERLRRVGLSAEVRRVFESPTLSDLAGSLMRGAEAIEVPPNLIPQGCERITPQMLPLVELEQTHIDRIVEAVPGGAANVQDIYPLAPLQEGMLFHHLLNGPARDAYVRPMLYETASREKLEELLSALQAIVDRHDVLRTMVLWEGLPKTVQVVCRQARLPVESITLDRERNALEQLKERMTPQCLRLDLRQVPMMRVQVAADPGGTRWYALLCTHHLVCDNQSIDVLFDELATYIEGHAEDLSQPRPYRDHVAQALAYARSRDAQAFFRSKLADVAEPTAPFGLMDVRGDGSEIRNVRGELEADLGERLRGLGRRLGVTAATMFHAAWTLVVSKASGREDVVFGTVLVGRLQGSAGAQRVLGMFINTLPLRLHLEGLTAKDLVEYTQRELVELLGYEQASLAEAQRCSAVSDSAPLFTALLNYRHSTKKDKEIALSGITLLGNQGRTNYPILLSVDDQGDGFSLEMETERRIDPQRMLRYVTTAVQSLVDTLESSPSAPALSLQVLPEEERRQVIEGFNPVHQYRQEELMQELFEGQVRLHPQAVAVSCEGRSLTYAELNARSNQLAWHLRERGIGAEQRVGICMERSLEMAVGLLGILKAGGAYVPLDPSYPAERLTYVLGDAAPSVVLTQEHLKGRLPKSAAEVVMIDTDWDVIGKRPTRDPALRPQGLSADSLAYVIYTSGSTGKPKGVMVEHRNVARLFAATQSWFGFNEQDVWTLFHSFAFDFSVWELWGALLYGGRVVIVPHLTARSPQEFYRLLCREGVTVLNQTPSAFAQLAQAQGECPDLRHALRVVIFGGEALEFRALRPWVQRNGTEQPRLINMYGITETTVHVTYRQLCKEEIESERGSIIGRPIPDLKTYLLDRHRQPVPIGVAGEIYVGGAGVARGYLNRPELTAERFVRDPFSDDPKARMYKTGDLGRWRADGTIEYLGRNDHQVKIRGFRIELGEIEAQLARHPEIKEAVVLAREDEPGEKRLVGYVIARDKATAPDGEALREHLKGVLPDYMVPSAFVMLESFPLTPNGKLDRRALPAPDLTAYTSRQYEAPQGEVEEILAGIWQELLRVQRVGRNDNFFELGGHSLLIVHMLERLRRVGLSAEVRRVFESPTLSDLAGSLMRGAEAIEVPPNLIPQGCERITPQMLPLVELEQTHIDRIVEAVPGGAANVQDIYPLAPLQEGILFHHLLDQERGDTYVLSTLLSVSSRARLEQLIAALQAVIDRHDILRTAILWERLSRPVQVVYRRAVLPVEETVLQIDSDCEKQIEEWLQPWRQRVELTHAPPLRLQIAASSNGALYALLQLHHITTDHVTTEVIIAEIVAHLEHRQERLPESVPYRQHVAQASAYAKCHDAEAFFRDKLADVEEPAAPFGLLDVYGDGTEANEAQDSLDDVFSRRLRREARRLNVSPATLFHAAWALVVSRTCGRNDAVFGTILLGRIHGTTGAKRSLGVFINTLPIRIKIDGLTTRELVETTRDELVDLVTHEQSSLATAQRCSGVASGQPLFTTLLNYRHSIPNPDSEWTAATGIKQLANREQTNYPILVSIDDLGVNFGFAVQTDPRIDSDRILAYLRTAVISLIDSLERAPEKLAASLQVLFEGERRFVIEAANATAADFPLDKVIHGLFEEYVERTPDAVAVEHEGRRVSYAQLNRRANQLARYLVGQGVGPDKIVGICMERGLEMVVGMLGILKAGGAYLPLDPNYPTERLSQMLEDAAPQVVLTESELVGVLPGGSSHVIALDEKLGQIAAYVDENLSPEELELSSENLVYVIYTSGSTGRPKGTAMRHRSVVNLIEWHRCAFGSSAGQRVLQFAALSFDVAFQEIFSTLCAGGTLVLLDEWVRRDAQALVELLGHQSIDRLFLPPLMLQSLAEYCKSVNRVPPGMKDVVTAGEQLSISTEIRYFFEQLRACRLHNHYGPTETHVVTTFTLTGDCAKWPARPPIGRPISNTKIYVLNGQMQPVPIGVSGEIYIGGASLARGYLNRPDLTEQRFVVDPYGARPDSRLYKTGDLGRWTDDGYLEFLGRNDDQIKIRGFRVELKEVEAQLQRHCEVKEAVVLAREDELGQKHLVGYVIARETATAGTVARLRQHLKAVLPEYMVPASFAMLEAFPLTPSGKLDRKALPTPELHGQGTGGYEAPRGEIEEVLAAIWREVLQIERLDRRDNFFEAGGHSLSATQVAIRIRSLLSVEIPIRALFRYRTLQELASHVSGLLQNADPSVSAAPEEQVQRTLELVAGMSDEEVRRLTKQLQSGVAS